MKLRSIRLQLTFWYTLVLLFGLSAFSVGSLLVLHGAVSTSKNSTLLRREERLLAFLNIRSIGINQHPLLDRLNVYAQFAPEGELIQVFDQSNRRIFPQDESYRKMPWPQGVCEKPCFGEMQTSAGRIRALHHVTTVDGQRLHVYVGGSMSEHDDLVNEYRGALLIMIPLVALLSLAGGSILSRRALLPVDRLTTASRHISIRSLSERLPVPQTGDELQRLAEAFNDLLARLDHAVSSLTQFTADASHDLRTSITVMLTTGQIALRRPRPEGEYREALDTVVAECRSTANLLDDMLTLARADAYTSRVTKDYLDLREIVEETCRRMQTLADSKRQQFRCELPTAAVSVEGNQELLQRLTGILVENAIKYTPAGGAICVSLHPNQKKAELRIADNGIGIAPEVMPKIFDRFFRADRSRNFENSGNGLGLAIAKWIADAHLATISVRSEPARGTVFSVNFAREIY